MASSTGTSCRRCEGIPETAATALKPAPLVRPKGGAEQKETLVRAEQARVITQAFAEAGIDKMDDAVMNALRDLVFGMMLRQSDEGRRLTFKYLLGIAKVMNRAKTSAIRERSAMIEERKLVLMNKAIELKRKQLEQETEGTAKKLNKRRVVTVEDLNRIRERVFGLPPGTEGG